MKPRILIVEDERSLRETLHDVFSQSGFEVWEAANGEEGLQKAEALCPDIVITDWKMPKLDGIAFLRQLRSHEYLRNTPVIVITAFAGSHVAIEAGKYGAFDFLTKPCGLEEIQAVAQRALQYAKLHRKQVAEVSAVTTPETAYGIIGSSKAMLRVFQMIGRAAQSDATVLIRGESGTGKELVAKAIHQYSARARHRFVAVNSAALAETLLESELFGHERGAFTGAVQRKQGRFELANEGTLFLDEIGEITLALQSKLLRVLEEKTFERVGGTESLRTSARVLAATNRDLESAIAQGLFREDLYYRLNVLLIHVPPLRERPEDILPLAEHFLLQYFRGPASSVARFSPAAKELLLQHSYPGNVRQLQNMIRQAASLMTGEVVLSEHLTPLLSATDAKLPEDFLQLSYHEAIEKVEKLLVQKSLERCGGNKSEAARQLGITRRLLYKKIREFQLSDLAGLLIDDEEEESAPNEH